MEDEKKTEKKTPVKKMSREERNEYFRIWRNSNREKALHIQNKYLNKKKAELEELKMIIKYLQEKYE